MRSLSPYRPLLSGEGIWATLLALVALALGLYHLGTPSLWFDELLSVSRASQSLPTLWHTILLPYNVARVTLGTEKASQATDPSALATYAAHHARLFYVTARLPNAAAVQRAQASVAWLSSHYHLLASFATSTAHVYLFETAS
ncbi:hypothetical protein [Thermogemmatispora onikobensis]|uniref:hypothetical protein n=1 Tax=Thermogemmatispora onikobensis TaxID=732234 RepID=UPI00114CBDD8|nr:hypothetical protein [Thermogemmatispora onikobensis]